MHAGKIFVIMRQNKRAFVERLDFQTSPGFLSGRKDERADLGLPGGGPKLVVTDMAVFGFDPETAEMTLEQYRPGLTVDDVRAEVVWPLKVSPDARPAEELRIIREDLDPEGIVNK